MAPLGLQMTTVGAVGGPGLMGDPGGSAAVIADKFWGANYSTRSDSENACRIFPKELGTVLDHNDIWDLVTISGVAGQYQTQDTSTHASEGNWNAQGSWKIFPINIPAGASAPTGSCPHLN